MLTTDDIDGILVRLSQPSMTEGNYLHAGNFFREEGVTLRRLTNAFGRLSVPDHIKSTILAGFNGDN